MQQVDQAKALEGAFGLNVGLGTSAPRPGSDESRFAKIVEEQVRKCRDTRWDHVLQAGLNDAYYRGRQYAVIDDRRRAVVDAPRSLRSGIPQLKLDFFKQDINGVVSRLGAGRPRFFVEAGTRDPTANDAAAVCESLLNFHEWEGQDMESVIAQFDLKLVLHAFAVLKVVFDPKAGAYLGPQEKKLIGPDGQPVQKRRLDIVDPLFGEYGWVDEYDEEGNPLWAPQLDENGQPIMVERWEGLPKTLVCDFRDLFWNPNAKDFETSNYKTERMRLSQQEVYTTWKETLEPSTQKALDHPEGHGTQVLRSERGSRDNDFPTIEVFETYLMPGDYPYGNKPGEFIPLRKPLKLITANSRVLAMGELDDVEDIPYVTSCFYRDSESSLGETFANSERELQSGTNKIASTIALTQENGAHTQLLVPTQTKVKKDAILKPKPGGVVEYSLSSKFPNAKPEYWVGPGASRSQYQFLDTLLNFRQTASGQHEGGMAGGSVAGVEAGVTYQQIIERDLGRLESAAKNRRRALQRWGKKVIHIWKTKIPEERVVRILGADKQAEFKAFSGRQIEGTFQTRVSDASTKPQSEAQRMALVQFMVEVLGKDPKDVEPMLGLDPGEQKSAEELHRSNAREEGQELLETGRITTSPDVAFEADDPLVHMEEHARLKASPRVRNNPALLRELVRHEQECHQPKLEQLRQEAAAAEAEALALQNAASNQPSEGAATASPAVTGVAA